MIMAIDGPANAKNNTVERGLAARLGFRYLNTGAMYRALTWLALEKNVDLDAETALGRLAARHPVTFDGERVLVRGENVTQTIRTPHIDRVVSAVARHPVV